MRMVNPPHPGDIVKTEVILPLGLTVVAAAKVLGVSRPTLSTFLNGRTPSPTSGRDDGPSHHPGLARPAPAQPEVWRRTPAALGG